MHEALLVTWVATTVGWWWHVEHKNNQCRYGLCQHRDEPMPSKPTINYGMERDEIEAAIKAKVERGEL